ncbi:hypothetical protein [Vibrio gangliei]|nr:hypothetical protein [Vibrio gangliei]
MKPFFLKLTGAIVLIVVIVYFSAIMLGKWADMIGIQPEHFAIP